MIPLVSELYATAVICLFWMWDSFCVACRFWQPCHISKMLWTLVILFNIHSFATFFNFQINFSFWGIQCCTIAHQYSSNGSSILPNYHVFPKHPASGFRLSPANNVLSKAKTGLRYDTMWYNRKYVASHIVEICVLSVCFSFLGPPVADIQ